MHVDPKKQIPPHIQALKIPPGWHSVRFNPDPDGDLLVLGKDSKGRRTAIYSAKFLKQQADLKFKRIMELDAKYDAILKSVQADVKKGNEAAATLRLVMMTGIRPGSEADTKARKQAYGATTLEGRHVVTVYNKVHLRFTGKKGTKQDLLVRDPAVASDLLARAKTAGPTGKLFNVTSGELLEYTHSKDGGGFKTKDFRTLLGTRTAMNEVAVMGKPKDEKAYKKAVREVAKTVSKVLGNTPTVALQSYISPTVFAEWQGGGK